MSFDDETLNDLLYAALQLNANLRRRNSDGTVGDLDAVRFWGLEVYKILKLDKLTEEEKQTIVRREWR